MRYQEYLEERDEVLRPRVVEKKPRPKKSDHKHEWVEVSPEAGIVYGISLGGHGCKICGKTKVL